MHLSNKLDAAVDPRALLNRALTIAKSQNARSLELRAAHDLARLSRDQGNHNEARELLPPRSTTGSPRALTRST